MTPYFTYEKRRELLDHLKTIPITDNICTPLENNKNIDIGEFELSNCYESFGTIEKFLVDERYINWMYHYFVMCDRDFELCQFEKNHIKIISDDVLFDTLNDRLYIMELKALRILFRIYLKRNLCRFDHKTNKYIIRLTNVKFNAKLSSHIHNVIFTSSMMTIPKNDVFMDFYVAFNKKRIINMINESMVNIDPTYVKNYNWVPLKLIEDINNCEYLYKFLSLQGGDYHRTKIEEHLVPFNSNEKIPQTKSYDEPYVDPFVDQPKECSKKPPKYTSKNPPEYNFEDPPEYNFEDPSERYSEDQSERYSNESVGYYHGDHGSENSSEYYRMNSPSSYSNASSTYTVRTNDPYSYDVLGVNRMHYD